MSNRGGTGDQLWVQRGGRRLWDQEPLTELDEVDDDRQSKGVRAPLKKQGNSGGPALILSPLRLLGKAKRKVITITH